MLFMYGVLYRDTETERRFTFCTAKNRESLLRDEHVHYLIRYY